MTDDSRTEDVAGGAAGRTRQLPPFHCPYCGDEELTPHGETGDGWRCGACLRAFSVRLIATGVREA